jgi:hypothetical protein
MKLHALKSVNNCLNNNVYSYLKTSGGKSSNLHLNVVHIFNGSFTRQLWHLTTVVFMHWCLMRTVQ